ncbi:hypothetical protein LWC33_26000 [Pseudonocardia sp. RS11V-5]|uniref:hypothetical protein n=1 Tax=Pseudonocardia terrae TaxID=2905831 RepID=UPI001E3851C9|nr:hypothetical protein [Pseudonocardia terrae]MCE3554895.1 hypothetical protein [Pseudonocardia terrae]
MDPHGLRTRRSLLDAGSTAAEIRRMRSSGTLALVRRGASTDPADDRLETPEARHALLVQATLPLLAKGSVISHASAAVLHGLRLWAVRLDQVHVTRDATSGGRTSRRLHLHTARLHDDEVVEVDGVAVTSLARTAVDLARTLPYEQAVVAVDSALDLRRARTPGRAPLTRVDWDDAIGRATGWPGGPAARRVGRFAADGAESAGESRSRIAIVAAGLPPPVLQLVVPRVAHGADGRVDFAWREQRVVGEFDGRVKYGRLLAPGQEAGDAVFAEKVREEAIRAASWTVLRWTWGELREFGPVAARLRRALDG